MTPNFRHVEIGCLVATALAVIAATLFFITAAMHLGDAAASLPWLRETVAMSRFSFFAWTMSVWIVAAIVGRASARREVSA